MRRLGGILADRSPNLVKTLGAIVVRREGFVVDRPRGRYAIRVLLLVKILAAQTIQHAAPELCVATDVVMRVGLELAAGLVKPPLARPVTQVLPDGFRVPVLVFLRHEIAAFYYENAGGRAGQRVRDGPAARTGADDDEVVVVDHCPMAAYT